MPVWRQYAASVMEAEIALSVVLFAASVMEAEIALCCIVVAARGDKF
jgi:hypothetical protein